MYTFLKIAPYSPIIDDLSKYDSLKLITKGYYDPSIDCQLADKIIKENNLNFRNIEKVYISKQTRSKETFYYLKSKGILHDKVKVIETTDLNEIKFDMKDVCQEKDYNKYGSNIVREKLIELFIQDKLIDSRIDIKNRFNRINKIINENQGKNILFISHTFTIKLFEIYNEKGKILFEDPNIIKTMIDYKKRIMNFLECK